MCFEVCFVRVTLGSHIKISFSFDVSSGGAWSRNLFPYLGGMGSGGFYAPPSERNRWMTEMKNEMMLEAGSYIEKKNKAKRRGEKETTIEDCGLHNDDFLDYCAQRRKERHIYNNVVEVAAIFDTAIEKQEKDLETKRRMYEDVLRKNHLVIESFEGKKKYKNMLKSVESSHVKAKMIKVKKSSEHKEALIKALKAV